MGYTNNWYSFGLWIPCRNMMHEPDTDPLVDVDEDENPGYPEPQDAYDYSEVALNKRYAAEALRRKQKWDARHPEGDPAYRAYVHACEDENLDHHDEQMWQAHGRPAGPLG